jgi:hypothetical protein
VASCYPSLNLSCPSKPRAAPIQVGVTRNGALSPPLATFPRKKALGWDAETLDPKWPGQARPPQPLPGRVRSETFPMAAVPVTAALVLFPSVVFAFLPSPIVRVNLDADARGEMLTPLGRASSRRPRCKRSAQTRSAKTLQLAIQRKRPKQTTLLWYPSVFSCRDRRQRPHSCKVPTSAGPRHTEPNLRAKRAAKAEHIAGNPNQVQSEDSKAMAKHPADCGYGYRMRDDAPRRHRINHPR